MEMPVIEEGDTSNVNKEASKEATFEVHDGNDDGGDYVNLEGDDISA